MDIGITYTRSIAAKFAKRELTVYTTGGCRILLQEDVTVQFDEDGPFQAATHTVKIYDREECERLIAALTQLRDAIWPLPQPAAHSRAPLPTSPVGEAEL